jgi:hypothetical protein
MLYLFHAVLQIQWSEGMPWSCNWGDDDQREEVEESRWYSHEPVVVSRVNDVVKSLEDVIEQSWNTLAEEPTPLELYWDDDQPWFWM